MKAQQYRGQSLAALSFAIGALLGFWNSNPDLQWLSYLVPAAALVFALVRAAQSFVVRRRAPARQFGADDRHQLTGIRRKWRWLTTDSELEAFHELCRHTMPDDRSYPTITSLKQRLRSNSNLIYGMFGAHGRVYHLDAAYVVYPLTASATEKFLDGSWDNSRGLEPRHIARRWINAKSVYVAALTGRPGRSQGQILEAMLSFVETHAGLPVLARRASLEGERTMERAGMRPINREDGVWVLAR